MRHLKINSILKILMSGVMTLGLLVSMGLSQPVFAKRWAKDLTNRLGVGYTNQGAIDLPSVAVRYYPNEGLGLSAGIGIDTEKDASKFGFFGKVYKLIFAEENMHFYMGSGASILSQEVTGKNNSGFGLSGFAGGEFFFSGLDSLGFSFEMGVSVTSISSEVRFRTIGDHPIKTGITFYF